MRLRHSWLVPILLGLLGCATPGGGPSDAVRTELAPTGKLRFGVVAGPERTEFFVVKNADGHPEGVPVDLARELGRRLGVPVEFRVASSPLELTEMLLGGKIDSAILPPDRWGRQRVDFGTFYFVDHDTYLVPRASRLKTIDEVDNRRVRVIAIEGTTTDRAAARRLRNTSVNPVGSIEGALEMLRTGQADAFAFTHASLAPLVERVPGSRILEGSVERVGLAFAVPKNRLYALDYVTTFTEYAKASGLVQRAFENAGLKDSQPAKPDTTAPVFWSFAPGQEPACAISRRGLLAGAHLACGTAKRYTAMRAEKAYNNS
jgi:polar amino acid transport system substrate-binding protein